MNNGRSTDFLPRFPPLQSDEDRGRLRKPVSGGEQCNSKVHNSPPTIIEPADETATVLSFDSEDEFGTQTAIF